MTTTVRIQHSVPSYEGWKRAFDSDPVDRRAGGVRRYTVRRSASDPNFVTIDLEFDDRAAADAFLVRLRALWDGPGRAVTFDPQGSVLETMESVEL
ncbi:MAG TPA: hypothetical protein VM052_05475 [Candidatus Limnocylindrales bacterium]|nr:hypothetical protein [Candidatus Limnocylindrales bacterium]